jgi:apolipoprotein N-acyltransferase
VTRAGLREALTKAPKFVVLSGLAILGAVAALGQPPIGATYATLIALIGLFYWFPQAKTPRQAAFGLWAFATAYFAVALRWLVEPFQVEADLFGWMAPFALAGMAAGLALFWAGAGWLALRLSTQAWMRIPMAVICVALAEVARAHILTGFPWGGMAQIWVDTPVSMGLSVFGPHGVGLLTLAFCAVLVDPAMRLPRRAFGAAGLAIASFIPALTTAPEQNSFEVTEHTIRIVQPNAPQHQKWDPDFAATFFWRQVEATRAGETPDLIVWPETAIPQLFNDAEETLKIVSDAARNKPVVLGMQRADLRGYYNSLLVMDGAGDVTQTYDKHHLVPFGEYMPMQWFFGLLGIEALAQRFNTGYAPGPGPKLIDLGPLGTALPLICYEAVFPQHARSADERPAFLLQITNDAWFGTYAGPQQHLAQARMRAIEQGLPLVRSANTGISAMVDPFGRITASLPLGEHGFVDAKLPMPRDPTLYSRTGDWSVAVLLLIALAGLISRRLTKIND